MSLRADLNSANPNRLSSSLSALRFGDLLNRILGGTDVNVPAAVASANASDLATAITLVNEIKAQFNLLRTAVLGALGVTEQAVTVTANVATLANQPSTLFSVIATTATTAGMKKLLIGPITGPTAIVPATGQCVWDGNKKVLFATADVVTVADFAYATAADTTVSLLQRDQGEVDAKV